MVDQLFVPDQRYTAGNGIYDDTDGVRLLGTGSACHHGDLAGSEAWLYGDRHSRGQRMDMGAAVEQRISLCEIKEAFA